MYNNIHKKNRRLKILTIMLMISLLCILFSACKEDEEIPTPSPISTIITLNHSELTIDLYDEAILVAHSTGSAVTWSSSDSSVVSVENGRIIALKVGKADITASADGASSKCEVTVVEGDFVPYITYNISGSIIEVIKGDSLIIENALMYKQIVYYPDFSYTAQAQQNIFTVDENGEIQGLNVGTALLTVSTVWRNAVVTDTITVSIKSGYDIELSLYSASIYTKTVNEYTDNITINGIVNYLGSKVDGASITWEVEQGSDSFISIAQTLNDNEVLITALQEGKAYIYAVFTSGNETVRSQAVEITVNVPTIQLNNVELFFDKYQQTFDGSGIADGDIVKISNSKGELDIIAPAQTVTLTQSAVNTLTADEQPQLWTVQIDGINYQVSVVVATKIITTAEEFRDIYTYADVNFRYPDKPNTPEFSGYIILGNNIDGGNMVINRHADDGYSWTPSSSGWQSGQYTGFCGTFDGRGYTIKGFSVASQRLGLFGYLGRGVTIKNVAIVDTNRSSTNVYRQLTQYLHYGNIENVYLSATASFSAAIDDCKWSNIDNLIIFGNYTSWPYGGSVSSNTISNSYSFCTGDALTKDASKGLTATFDYQDYKTDSEFLAINWSSFDITQNGYWEISQSLDIPIFKSINAATEIGEIKLFDKYERTFDGASIAPGTITKITNSEGELDIIEPGQTVTLTEAAVNSLTAGDHIQTWNVWIDNINYKVYVIVATKIITTAQQFVDLYTYADVNFRYPDKPNTPEFSGYIILGNNIDGGDMVVNRHTNDGYTWGYISGGYTGFCGIFDGCGYTIKGFKVAGERTGLFGYIGKGGTIKNVAVIDTLRFNTSVYRQFAHTVHYAKLENIFISSTDNFAAVIDDCKWTEINNLLVFGDYYGYPYAGSVATSGSTITTNTLTASYSFTAQGALDKAAHFRLNDAFLYTNYKADSNFTALTWASYNINGEGSIWKMSDTLDIPVFKTVQ